MMKKSRSLLDVRRSLLVFKLSATNDFQLSDVLFILFAGKQKRMQASKATVVKWIKLTICEAYSVMSKEPVFS